MSTAPLLATRDRETWPKLDGVVAYDRFPGVPFTWARARASGVGRRELDAAVAQGRVRRVMHGVYVRADVQDTQSARAQAAFLVLSPGCIARDRTAAWLHDVDTFEFREFEVVPPLEVCVLSGRNRTRRAECKGGERALLARDVCMVGGVPATTPLRTALDLGCRLTPRGALAVLDGFLRRHGLTQSQMEAELPRYRGRRGVVQLRRLIPLADARAESPGESFTRMAIIEEGLPAPELQVWVPGPEGRRFRLDMGYTKSKVAVEYDGRQFHDAPEHRLADSRRRQWLRDHGWTVIVVDKDSFKGPALDAWLRQLRAALALG